ncbi:MAG TPA: tyrosine-type recombinase/integrase, partial [Burkholderiaceae bacterium]
DRAHVHAPRRLDLGQEPSAASLARDLHAGEDRAPLRFHELRHSYASALAQAGADLLTISKLLGHADRRVTARHYAHLCDRTPANAVNNLLPIFGDTEASNAAAIR